MKTFFATLACAAAASSTDTLRFYKWAIEHGRNYQTVEEIEHRMSNYMRNEAEVEHLNSLGHSATYAVNNLSDYTEEEYKDLLGYEPEYHNDLELYETEPAAADEDYSDNALSVDWRTKGAVTDVKDQAGCAACWAFSATGAMEGAHYIETGELLNLSEQQIIDCDTKVYGCMGGTQRSAFQYAQTSYIETASDYPYEASDSSCKYDQSQGKLLVGNYTKVKSGSIDALKSAISKGPTAVTVEADQSVFQNYSSGIVCSGCGTDLDHAVLAVGYGTENGQGYYMIKNSFGSKWGDNGYIKIGMEIGLGCCGIQQESYNVSTI